MQESYFRSIKPLVVAALGVAMLGMGSATASPITSWTFTSSASFDTSQTVFQTQGNSVTTNTSSEIAWGKPVTNGNNPDQKQSSLVIDPSTGAGTVNTYIGGGSIPSSHIADPGVVLTHNNYSITVAGGHWLTDAQLDLSFDLSGPDNQNYSFALNMPISFVETPNSDTCPVAPTPGNRDCPDFFIFGQDSLNRSFLADDEDGEMEGREYFVSLFPSVGGSVGILPDAACAAGDMSSGCFGFITQEDHSTPLNFGVTVSTKPVSFTSVPGPSGLALLGFALLGIAGVVTRRRHEGNS